MCLVQNLIFWLFLRGTNTPPASAGNYDAHPYAFNLVFDITFTKNIKLGFDYDFGEIEHANDLAPVTTLRRFQLEADLLFRLWDLCRWVYTQCVNIGDGYYYWRRQGWSGCRLQSWQMECRGLRWGDQTRLFDRSFQFRVQGLQMRRPSSPMEMTAFSFLMSRWRL